MSTGRTLPAGPALAALAASVVTTCAVIAAAGQWGPATLAQPLWAATGAAWIVFAVTVAASLVLAEMRDLANAMTATIEDYGDARHSDGIGEGFRRAAAEPTRLAPVARPR